MALGRRAVVEMRLCFVAVVLAAHAPDDRGWADRIGRK
jgi:hypothetical protein